MKRLFVNFDWFLFGCVILLLVLGLAMIQSVAPQLFVHQMINVGIGLLLFFLFSQIDYRIYSRLKHLFYFFSMLSLALTFVFGAVTRGSVRWLGIGEFAFQPSEIVKPFLVFSLAAFLISYSVNNWHSLFKNIFLLLPPFLLILTQPDLGSSLVVVFFWLGMVLAAGIPRRSILAGALVLLLFLPLSWFWLQNYQQARILSFLNPFEDPLGSGYTMIQSMVAVGSGQWLGRGLGRGTQSHLRFLPERHTDFIFASLAEELGFLGAGLLIIVYFLLLWRLLKTARLAKDKYGFLIALGVFSFLFAQVFINLGMNLGLVPITGLTLPLISYGGSSLAAILICLGTVVNISRQGKQKAALID